jgi:hypothetical protein
VGRRSQLFGAVLLVLALVVPFLGKPVHVDDTNFLRLAEGAAQDPWRPHAIEINWLGVSQRAYDVLSNPPGIGWWLAPVRHAPLWAQHLWMLPWLALALWGMHRLGEAMAGSGPLALLVFGTSPVLVLSAQSLTPDLPLVACAVAGTAGFVRERRAMWAWAMLAGCGALFRYSGLCVVPLLLFAGFERRRVVAASAVAIPIAALVLHDLHAYGGVHALAMAGFQGVSYAPPLMFRKAVALVAMLGGACMLPLLPWRRLVSPLLALGGGILGLAASLSSGHTTAQILPTVLFGAAGAVSTGAFRLRDRKDRFVALWFFGGFLFLLTLQFAATRYWLVFLPALVIAVLRQAPARRTVACAVLVSALVSLGMAVDDDRFARAYREAAWRVARSGPGVFSGHWGWQYYLEEAGWKALEAGDTAPPILAVAWAPWPQPPASDSCLLPVEQIVLEDRFFGPRVHTALGAANYHSSSISAQPPIETYAPWTFANDPYDHITIFRRCDVAKEQGSVPRIDP